jgi:hypothetical protein
VVTLELALPEEWARSQDEFEITLQWPRPGGLWASALPPADAGAVLFDGAFLGRSAFGAAGQGPPTRAPALPAAPGDEREAPAGGR